MQESFYNLGGVALDVIFLLLLAIHCYSDIKYMLLYDKVTLFLAAVGLWRAWYLGSLLEAVSGAAVLLAIMLLLYLASRGGMGEGDVKLAPALGLWLGVQPGLVCLLLAFVSGGAVGGMLLACGRTSRRQVLPFGPFLCLAAVVAHFWGRELLVWYWGLF